MADAIRDENHVPVIVALSYIDGVTLVPVQIDADNAGVKINTSASIQFTPTTYGKRDSNHVVQLMGVSSSTGLPFPVLADPATGAILVDL